MTDSDVAMIDRLRDEIHNIETQLNELKTHMNEPKEIIPWYEEEWEAHINSDKKGVKIFKKNVLLAKSYNNEMTKCIMNMQQLVKASMEHVNTPVPWTHPAIRVALEKMGIDCDVSERNE